MRWVMFILVALVVLTIQSAVAPRVELLGARPDWLLVIVVFFALHACRRDAVLAAWMVGACADLMTIERFGLIALSYVLVALCVLSCRDYLFRLSSMTQFVVTMVACFLVRSGWIVYGRVMYGFADTLLSDLMIDVIATSVYTAFWAPPVHICFLRIRGAFGLARPRYGYAA